MRYCLIVLLLLIFPCISVHSKEDQKQPHATVPVATQEKETAAQVETIKMLTSLVKLQEDIKQQIEIITTKLETTTSDAEKSSLQDEISRLDRQLAGTSIDFERIATGVEVALFAEKKPETFSWKEEFAILVQPAIKELKRLTIRTRNKTRLKDTIQEYDKLAPVAQDAVMHLVSLFNSTEDTQIKAKIKNLLPEWKNVEHAILNKLELAELELARLEEQEIGLTDSLSNSTRDFFRNRGIYLLGAVIAFIGVLLLCRLVYRIIFAFMPVSIRQKLPFHIRLFDLLFRVFALVLAGFILFYVLYLAEDWFLLSLAIVFFLALMWTLRQGISKLWQQARLMLNVGAVREGERVILYGVPWKVERIHVFCNLHNPSLNIRLRLPIEDMVGKVSRVFKAEEPWFPCKKGDWVIVGDGPRGKVVSLSHETVELVERGGKRIIYQTQDFLGSSPINLSRNFRLRVPFGITYNLQSEATTIVPEILQTYLAKKIEEKGYAKNCLDLSVEFMQAGGSSLDLMVLADFKGEMADIYSRLERLIQQWCVEACTINNWEIPFPQLTFHWPEKEKLDDRREP